MDASTRQDLVLLSLPPGKVAPEGFVSVMWLSVRRAFRKQGELMQWRIR